MAHHNSTPRRVLEAPVLTPEVVVPQRSRSRRERRHGIYLPPHVTVANPMARSLAVLLANQQPPNAPQVSTRVRKVRRGRKARFNR